MSKRKPLKEYETPADPEVEHRKGIAKEILLTFRTPGWRILEMAIVNMRQAALEKGMGEDDKAKQARADARAWGGVLNFFRQKAEESAMMLKEEADAEEKK